MDYPKSVPGIGLVDGKFVDENTTSGRPGSLIPSDWGNSLTDEVLNVIQAGELEPSEMDRDQLLKAIRAIIEKRLNGTSALPIGSMVPFPKGEVPLGFLEVDGSEQSIATYPDLAAYLGTTFNVGNEEAGYFRLPESRGEFFRGWAHRRDGVDAGRQIGTYQGDENKAHFHYDPVTDEMGSALSNIVAGKVSELGWSGIDFGGMTGAAGSEANENVFKTSTVGGVESRPRNLAVMWCIKAWNAPVNQGVIDIAALAVLAAPATEIRLGTAKIATQVQVKSGIDDATIVTPKKLRFGFSIALATTGFVAFPSWLGGLIIQWGTTNSTNVTFPLQFSTSLNHLVLTANNYNSSSAFAANYQTATASSTTGFTAAAVLSAPGSLKWLAFGS